MSAVIQNEYIQANNTTVLRNFTFPYLKTSDIKVSLDGVNTTAFTLPNATTIQLNSVPPVGTKIKIFRETSVDDLTATFYAGSAIKSEDLNDNFTQNLYKTQEVGERALNTLGDTMTGDLTMGEATKIIFEGTTDDANETTITVADPTADRTITFPNVTGNVVTTGDTGTVARAMIANDAVDGTKINDDSINSEHYVDLSIDTQHIGNLQVTDAKLADSSVIRAKIQADAIDGSKIADDVIDSEHYAHGSIDTIHIADNQVTADKLADTNVIDTADKLAADVVTTTKILNLNVTTSKLAADAVTGAKIADDEINSEHYASGSIDTEHIAPDQITNALIADSQIDSEHYVDGSIDHEHLSNDCVDEDNIQDDAVRTEHVQANAITDAEILTGTLDNRYYTETEAEALFLRQDSSETIASGVTWSASDDKVATTAAIDLRIIELVDDVGGFVPIANETSFPTTNPDINTSGSAKGGTIVSVKTASTNLVPSSGTVTIANGRGSGLAVILTGVPSTIPSGFGFLVETTATDHTYAFHRLLPKATEVTTVAANATAVATVATNVSDVNNFYDLYQISTSAPTARADSTSLQHGDLWFDSSSNKVLMIYDGSSGDGFTAATPNASDLVNINIVAGHLVYQEDLGLITNAVNTGSGNNSVNTVAASIANVNTVAADLNEGTSEIDTVATNITNVNNVGNSITNVNTVAGSISNVNAVAGNATNINNVAADATDIGAVAGKATEIGRLGTAAAVADLAILGTNAIVSDMDTLADISSNITTVAGVSSNVTTVAGIASNVTAVAGNATNINAVAADATDIGAVAGKATEIGRLGTAAAVADLAILGTTDVVADLNTLATTAIVSDMDTLADISANITTVAGIASNVTTVAGNNSNVTAVAGNNSNITSVANNATNINAVQANASNINAAVSNATNINTVAASIGDVNRYASEYVIQSGTPSSPSTGDLWYNSTSNVLNYYNGSTFVGISPGIAGLINDSNPALANHLDCNDKNLTEVGTVSGNNLQIDFGTI